MDHIQRLAHFRNETAAFEKAIARAIADAGGGPVPLVPSCPGWSASDLLGHLGAVHRFVGRILRDRLSEAPDHTDLTIFGIPQDPAVRAAWPKPGTEPNRGPVPDALTEWFAQGARQLEDQFRELGPDVPVWTWSPDAAEHTSGFWLRMQTIELAVHRWDAQSATGTPGPVDAEIAADAVPQTFEAMAPFRRAVAGAPAGAGERYRFRRTDGPGVWTVTFSGEQVTVEHGATDPVDVEAAGTASDLMLFLWRRIPATALAVSGAADLLPHYFTLVPPV
ncbi:maleylpyruvate isomerase family mycothiol-dependent enzyme [Streptomyces sp. NRRL S-244]|uniref:maleylpyruvate isomerase family mycothiol-dependent enzyme n=1 Tax=Streptomyces sp. NRRL S-244 TaxID=1463897 RepID=UPI0004C09102|nr:maleylpyruvate isomerase family mycothiol-dependent enzyme [Streptomyces sp. NRRL S-244]